MTKKYFLSHGGAKEVLRIVKYFYIVIIVSRTLCHFNSTYFHCDFSLDTDSIACLLTSGSYMDLSLSISYASNKIISFLWKADKNCRTLWKTHRGAILYFKYLCFTWIENCSFFEMKVFLPNWMETSISQISFK